jgi:outer membrane protein
VKGLSVLAAVSAAVILAAPRVNAQTPQASQAVTRDTLTLTLEQAVSRATSESQEVRLAQSQVALARAQVSETRAGIFPQLSGQLGYTRTFASAFSGGGGLTLPDSLRFEPDSTASLAERVSYLERRVPTAGLGGLGALFGNLPFGQENSYTATLNGSQVLYSGGKVGAGLRIADQFVQAARLELQEQTAEIELQVRSAYYRASLSQELVTISEAAVAQARRFLASEQLRLQAGLGSELDVLRAEVSLANLQPSLIDATNAAEVATLDLKRLIDVPLAQPLRLATHLDASSIAAGLDTATATTELLSRRASVAAAERQVRIREEQVRIARGNYLPSVDLRFAYGKQLFPSALFRFNEDWRTDFTAGFSVSVPIFNGNRTRAEVAQAQVELEQQRLRLAQLRENVQLDYERARGERERTRASIQARQRTVQQAQRVYDLTVLRYEQGLASQLEVSDSRLALLQARTNLAQAVADFQIATARVNRALGQPSAR